MPLLDSIRAAFGQRSIADLDSLSSKERQDFLNAAADLGEPRLERYETFADYYDGDQRTQLLQRASDYLEASGLRFSENFSETVVDVHSDRLRVERFEVVDNQAATDWLNDQWWARNRGDEVQGVVHTETLKLGDGCLIADFDGDLGLPRTRWNSPARVKFVYSDDGTELLYVPKVWKSCERSRVNPQGRPVRRMNLYFPDRVEKWFSVDESKGAEWAPWVDDDDVQLDPAGLVVTDPETALPLAQWPVWWTDTGTEDGEPLGVPVTHFRHKAQGRHYGRSLLRNVIPYNDMLNKQALDLFYVMDTQGWKQRHAAGIGETESLAVAIGEWVTTTNQDARFGEFSAEDPRPLLEVMEGTLRRMSARSRTPLHEMLIKGEVPSGKALKAASSGITSATEERQTTFGNSWEDHARISWRIGSVFGDAPDFDPEAVIEAQWKSAEVHDGEVEAGVHEAELRMGVVSRRTISEQRGYDWDTESERIAEEKQESLDRMTDAFNRGAGGPIGAAANQPPQPPNAVGGGE